MSNESSKPRELDPIWIECEVSCDGDEDSWSFDLQVTNFEGHDQGQLFEDGDKIEFIEKSAHDAALARIAELEKENKNLKTSLTVQREVCEAIDDNGLQAFRLQQQNQALNNKIKLLEKERVAERDQVRLWNENEKLRAKLKIAEEALQFLAKHLHGDFKLEASQALAKLRWEE